MIRTRRCTFQKTSVFGFFMKSFLEGKRRFFIQEIVRILNLLGKQRRCKILLNTRRIWGKGIKRCLQSVLGLFFVLVLLGGCMANATTTQPFKSFEEFLKETGISIAKTMDEMAESEIYRKLVSTTDEI